MKDIFIDASLTQQFSKTPTVEYATLIEWLYKNNIEKDKCAFLVVSQHLITEYYRASANSTAKNALSTILNQLTKEGRINKITNTLIQEFKTKHFKGKWDSFRCKKRNSKDPEHIIAICLSNRQMAITLDNNLFYDLENLKLRKFDLNIKVAKNPNELNYID